MIGTNNIKRALRVDVAISSVMADALQTWSLLYSNQASWLNKEIRSLNLPAAIAGEIARVATIEMKVMVTGSPRALFLQAQMDKIMLRLREMVEYGCAKGGLMFKPYVRGGEIAVDFVQADQFYPVAFDASGHITACVFADQRQMGDQYYTRLELHQMTGSGCYIRNMAFKSSVKDELGQQVALTEIEDWAALMPEATVINITKPLFGYFRYPSGNNIDPGSPLGVSCYARAVDLIEDADRQWSNLIWEFESGKRALYADVTAFSRDKDGKPILPDRRLYRSLNSGGNVGDDPEGLFHEWSPEFREASIQSGLDNILKRIEFTCGLAYGSLSDPQSVEKTATEIATSKQRTYATVVDTQKALQQALEDLLYAMDIWASLGNLAPGGTYNSVYDFDDSVVVNRDAQFQQDLRLVSQGIMGKVEFRMRNLKEDEKTAKEKVAAAQGEQPADFFQDQGK